MCQQIQKSNRIRILVLDCGVVFFEGRLYMTEKMLNFIIFYLSFQPDFIRFLTILYKADLK